MSSRRLIPAHITAGESTTSSTDEATNMRREYRIGIAIAIILALTTALVLGLVFCLGSTDKDAKIHALQVSNAHLETELMGLMMNSLTFSTRYIQNGTCTFGYPATIYTRIQTVSDYSDYVTLNYTLKEILLTPASVPLTVLELSATPRPIVINGYTPPAILPQENDLLAILGIFDPPIAPLDTLSQVEYALAYSYIMASRIAISPNCVAMTNGDHNPAHCTQEVAFSPFFSASFPTPNSVTVFTNNLNAPGHSNMQFLWGHWDYSSIANQYDFTGTTLSFSAPIQMLLPNL